MFLGAPTSLQGHQNRSAAQTRGRDAGTAGLWDPAPEAGQPQFSTRADGGHQLLTFQDVPPLQLLHGRSLAQPSAEKHQNYVLHHGGCLRIPLGSVGSEVAGAPLEIAPQKLQEEKGTSGGSL